jgi:hypothetical protein
MQLENIAQLLQTQNELIQKLLQPQEDEKTQRRKILQAAIESAETNKANNTDTAEYIIP